MFSIMTDNIKKNTLCVLLSSLLLLVEELKGESSSSSDSVSIYSNCNGLSDGSYFLRLIDDGEDTYPIVNVKCSNGYMILDVNYDSELKSYFNTWFDWHYGLSGPARYDAVNWEKWFLVDSASSVEDTPSRGGGFHQQNMMGGGPQGPLSPDESSSSSSSMDYKPSMSCSTCDMLTYNGEIESESVAYYMSTDTRMCMGEVAGLRIFLFLFFLIYPCATLLGGEKEKRFFCFVLFCFV